MSGFADVRADVQVFDTGRMPVDLFVELALVPLLNAFPGDDGQDAQKHVEACRAALSGERAHGSAGFYATFARKA